MKIETKTDLTIGSLVLLGTIILVVLCCMDAHAANHYIRAGAGGSNDGTDWTNAWTSIPDPTTFVRGDEYFFADDIWTLSGDLDLDAADSGTTYIYLTKATATDHGTEIGWDSAYGDGVCEFRLDNDGEEIIFDTNYWDVNGNSGGGPDSWSSGHGFKWNAYNLTFDDNTRICLLYGAFGVSTEKGSKYINLRHIEFAATGQPEFGGCEALKNSYADPNTPNDFGPGHVTVEYCFFNHLGGPCIFVYEAHDWLVQYCYFLENEMNEEGGNQGTCIYDRDSDHMVYRYNIFQDIEGTAVLDLKTNDNEDYEDWDVYGNVFFNSSNDIFEGRLGNGVFVTTQNGSANYCRDMKFINNTLINLKFDDPVTHCTGVTFGDAPDMTGNMVANNVWYDCNEVGHARTGNDYNAYISCEYNFAPHGVAWDVNANDVNLPSGTNPFEGWADKDFRLDPNLASAIACIDAGLALGSPYDTDWAGTDREADDGVDLGVLEVTGDEEPPPTRYLLAKDRKCALEQYIWSWHFSLHKLP